MIGVVGVPGSVHHTWEHFASRAEAEAWCDKVWRSIRERNPAGGVLQTQVMSDAKARGQKYQDGTSVYKLEKGGAR